VRKIKIKIKIKKKRKREREKCSDYISKPPGPK
jgi:hypothetical protein